MLTEIGTTIERLSGLKVQHAEPLNRYNSLRVGGPADYFVEVFDAAQLAAAVGAARKVGLPYVVIGNGTNLIFTDAGVRGLVIRTRAHHHKVASLIEQQGDQAIWRVGAGALWGPLCREMAAAGWGDLSWGISIPGSMGGAIVSNAGAHGGDTSGVLHAAQVLTAEGVVEEWQAERFGLSYRSSILKAAVQRAMSPGLIVLSLDFCLHREQPAALEAKMREAQAYRIASQPAGKTAGSTFKNPPGDKAGQLIEAAGLKGYTLGSVQFSPKHANFLMNLGAATYDEARRLIAYAQGEVYRQFGVTLELEVEVVGENP